MEVRVDNVTKIFWNVTKDSVVSFFFVVFSSINRIGRNQGRTLAGKTFGFVRNLSRHNFS